MSESLLFSPIALRGITSRNRIWAAPMAQYSAPESGVPTDWHLAHLGGMARGGAGLVMTEATAVEPVGRLGNADTGIWNDEQVDAWRRITRFISDMGATSAIQLAHSGRKGSIRHRGTPLPAEEGGWQVVAPSAIATKVSPNHTHSPATRSQRSLPPTPTPRAVRSTQDSKWSRSTPRTAT